MGKRAAVRKLKLVPAETLKLDFGCGPHKREGFKGVDKVEFVGVDYVVDLTQGPWPWADGSVVEAHASHFLEHLTQAQRTLFANELYRVLKPGGTCQIITPHWSSNRAYGDPTHQWPPVAEMWYFYLNRKWRKEQAPHTDKAHNPEGFDCDFIASWGYNMRPELVPRNLEYQQYALTNYKEACQDLIATVVKPAEET